MHERDVDNGLHNGLGAALELSGSEPVRDIFACDETRVCHWSIQRSMKREFCYLLAGFLMSSTSFVTRLVSFWNMFTYTGCLQHYMSYDLSWIWILFNSHVDALYKHASQLPANTIQCCDQKNTNWRFERHDINKQLISLFHLGETKTQKV